MALACALLGLGARPNTRQHQHEQVLLQPSAPAAATEAAPDVPTWARNLARRLGPHASPQTLLADWTEDKRRFLLNTTSRVARGPNSGPDVRINLAALPLQTQSMATKNITIAVMQMQALHGRANESMQKADALLRAAPPGDFDLLVLPELAFTGYVWDSADEIRPQAEQSDGPSFQWAQKAAKERNSHVLLGFVEQGEGDALHNSAMMVSPAGELVMVARKTALTDTDAQWATSGTGSKSMPVTDTPFGRVGVGICKDMSAVPSGAAAGEHSMDENFRAAGVDIIVVLAAWDSQDAREVVHNKWMARVGKHLGTKTLLVIADQSGSELGVPFAGSSAVMDLSGPTTLAVLSESDEAVGVQTVVDFPLKSAAGSTGNGSGASADGAEMVNVASAASAAAAA